MAEDTIQAPEQVEVQQPVNIENDVAAMMAISLNGGIVPENLKVGGETQAPATTETPETVPTPTQTPDFFSSIKEYGFDSQEAAVEALKEYRSLKEAPRVVEPTFENEESKTLYELIKAGKTPEVYEILGQQQKINSLLENDVTDDNAGDIIKLGLQLKHKDLTQREIDYKFNKMYQLPKEPVQSELEDEADFKVRHDEWQERVNDVKMSLVIDAKLAKPDLAQAKKDIKLPDLQTQVDEDYIQWKKSLEEEPQLAAERETAYKSLSTKSLKTELNFKDEANKIDFNFQFEPDNEGFNKSVEMALDVSKFFNSFIKSDGTPDREGFLKAIYFAKNADNILIEAMKQAKNATIKSFLPDNSGGGTQRQFPQTQEISELDKMMQAALGQYMPKAR